MTAPQTGTAAAGNGGGASTGSSAAASTTTPDTAHGAAGGGGGISYGERAEQAQGIVDRLVLRHGTMARALEVLAGENFEQREQLRAVRSQLDQRPALAAGAVVLTPEQKAEWEKFTALKLPADKVAERVKRADELESTVGAQQRQTLVTKIAQAAKFNPDVLGPLLTTNNLEAETRGVTVRDSAGKETVEQTAYVRKAGDANATWEKLSDYAARADSPFKPFLPALKAVAATGAQTTESTSSGASGNASAPQGGVTHAFPAGSTSSDGSQGDATAGSVVDQHLKKRNENAAKRTNPLRPASASTTQT